MGRGIPSLPTRGGVRRRKIAGKFSQSSESQFEISVGNDSWSALLTPIKLTRSP